MLVWLLAMPALVCFIIAVATLHFMRVKTNRRLPESDKISYFLPMTRWNKVTDAYKRLYLEGCAYIIWRVAVIGTAVLAMGIVLSELWELALGK